MLDLMRTDHRNAFADLSAMARAPGPEYLEAGRQALAGLLADPTLLDKVELKRTPGAYTRNLVFGDKRISVYAMVWSPGARTSIHDHHCACCYAILSGSLQEAWYEPVDKTHVVQSKLFTRSKGQIACMLPTGPNLHKMANPGRHDAISLHIYGYDCRTRASSVGRVYVELEPATSV